MGNIKKTSFMNIIGTSFHGDEIYASINELIAVLNIHPEDLDDGKTRFEWRLEYLANDLYKPIRFTIYDYLHLWTSDKTSNIKNAKILWHIGAMTQEDSVMIKNIMDKLMNK